MCNADLAIIGVTIASVSFAVASVVLFYKTKKPKAIPKQDKPVNN